MRDNYDVIVCGGGTSGVMAAISAARNGMSVLLLEKTACLGGMNTSAMVSPLMTFHAGEKQVVRGLGQEIIDRLAKRNATLGHIKDPIGMVSTITPIDSEALKLLYFEMVAQEQNITLLLNSMVTAITVKDGIIESVSVVTKGGKLTFKGKTVIDATGDGDIMMLAKESIMMGRAKDGMAQPMTLVFKVGGIDMNAVRTYIKNNPEQFIWNSECDVDGYVAVSGFFTLVKQAQQNKDLTLPRDRVLFFQGLVESEAIVNMSRIIKLSAIDPEEMTRAEVNAHAQVDEIMRFLQKYIPGFENSYLMAVANEVGVRESRRLSGQYTLTADDVIHNECRADSVAVCAFPMDIHSPSGSELNWVRKEKNGCYDIPYGVMLPQKTKNLLVTGRCISATHEALASARISATAMALGEAAGLACALSVQGGVLPGEIDVSRLQEKLVSQNAIPGKRWM